MIVPPSLEQLLVGRERDCKEGREVMELNFESGRFFPLLCKIPTISTPLFGLDLPGEVRIEGSTMTAVCERCFVALLGGGSVVAREGLVVVPAIRSAQRREPISSDVTGVVLVLSEVEERVLVKIR